MLRLSTARTARKASLVAAVTNFALSGCGLPVSVPRSAANTRDAGLPVGRFDLGDTEVAMTVTIPASGWTFVPPDTPSALVEEMRGIVESTTIETP